MHASGPHSGSCKRACVFPGWWRSSGHIVICSPSSTHDTADPRGRPSSGSVLAPFPIPCRLPLRLWWLYAGLVAGRCLPPVAKDALRLLCRPHRPFPSPRRRPSANGGVSCTMLSEQVPGYVWHRVSTHDTAWLVGRSLCLKLCLERESIRTIEPRAGCLSMIQPVRRPPDLRDWLRSSCRSFGSSRLSALAVPCRDRSLCSIAAARSLRLLSE
jgi:hypothetical protein